MVIQHPLQLQHFNQSILPAKSYPQHPCLPPIQFFQVTTQLHSPLEPLVSFQLSFCALNMFLRCQETNKYVDWFPQVRISCKYNHPQGHRSLTPPTSLPGLNGSQLSHILCLDQRRESSSQRQKVLYHWITSNKSYPSSVALRCGTVPNGLVARPSYVLVQPSYPPTPTVFRF